MNLKNEEPQLNMLKFNKPNSLLKKHFERRGIFTTCKVYNPWNLGDVGLLIYLLMRDIITKQTCGQQHENICLTPQK